MRGMYFDFMGKRLYAAIFSGVLVVVAVGALLLQGLNRGLDFTGGALMVLENVERLFIRA